jgi:hypothetical protein
MTYFLLWTWAPSRILFDSTTTGTRGAPSRRAATFAGSREHRGIGQSLFSLGDRRQHFPGNGVLIRRCVEHQLEQDGPLELLDVVDHGTPLGASDPPRSPDAARGKHLDAQWHFADMSIPYCTCLWFFHQSSREKNGARANALYHGAMNDADAAAGRVHPARPSKKE